MFVAVTDGHVDCLSWLDAEIAHVEGRLAAQPPMCTLDRPGSAPPGLKELEGRYALLRRARKLIDTGGDLSDLGHEVHQAEQIARASPGASPQWIGYARGVAVALDDIRRRKAGSPRHAASSEPR